MTNQEMIEEIIQAMANKGWRITEQRRSLAALFANAAGYLSPRDVYEYMSADYPGISFDTVYRNLRLLSDMGVLEQVHLPDGVKFRARCKSHHHHHLICVDCETTVTLDFCPMKFAPELPDGFQMVNHRFEIFGYCPECRSKKSASAHPEAGH